MQISSYLPPSLGCTSWTTHPIIFRSSAATSITRVTLPLTVPRRGLEVVCTVKDMMEKEVNGETLPKKIISYAPQYLAYHQVSVVRPEQRILPSSRCLSWQLPFFHSHPPEGWKLFKHHPLLNKHKHRSTYWDSLVCHNISRSSGGWPRKLTLSDQIQYISAC